MKNKYFLLCMVITLILVLPLSSNQLLIKGGMNLTDLSGMKMFQQELDFYNKTYFSLVGGFHYRFDLNNYLSLQPEILYTQKHAKYVLKDLNIIYKFDYIEIPLLFKVHFLSSRQKIVPFIVAGPYASFRIKSEQFLITSQNSYTTEYGVDSDYGLTVGTGLDFNFNSLTFLIEVRFNYGLGKLNKDISARVSGFSFMAGIGIY